jgi:hypothetical protein
LSKQVGTWSLELKKFSVKCHEMLSSCYHSISWNRWKIYNKIWKTFWEINAAFSITKSCKYLKI